MDISEATPVALLAPGSVTSSGGYSAKQRPSAPAALPLYSCPDCGGPVTNPRHMLCEACQAGAGHTPAVRQTRGRAIAAANELSKSGWRPSGRTSTRPFIASRSCPSSLP